MTYEPAFDDYTGDPRPHAVFQPGGHGPVGMVGARVAARCWQCGWDGPDRTGDPHAAALLIDDVTEHAHQVGANCGMCAACQGEA